VILMRLKMMVPVGRRASGTMITARLLAAALATFAIAALAGPASGQAAPLPWPNPDVTYAAGQGAKVTGPIVSRRGDDLLVRDETTKLLSVVTIRDGTKITQPTGFMKMEKKRRDDAVLIPGLVIVVKGTGGDRGNLVADGINFSKNSLKTASQVSAGEVDLRAHASANTDSIDAMKMRARDSLTAINDSLSAMKDRARDSLEAFHARIENLDKWDVKSTTTVNFEINSSKLSAEAKSALDDAVAAGMGTEGYIIEVAGYADTTGSNGLNQRLSAARARAVVAYLTQAHSVPLRRFINPSGLGSSHPVASNDTADGRAENRRVEVKLLVNRGLVPPHN